MTVLPRIALAIAMCMTIPAAYTQAIFAPRAVALGGYAAPVHDTRGFTANPTGLTEIRDWDFTAATSRSTAIRGSAFVFEGFGLAKRFLQRHAVAFQYTPGSVLDFVQPSTVSVIGLNIPTDRQVTYSEPLAVAYAVRISDAFSCAVQGRLRTEKISDPQYQFEIKDTAIVSVSQDFKNTTWFADIGLSWKATPELTLSALGRGVVRFVNEKFPSDFSPFSLPRERSVELGLSYTPDPALLLSAAGSTAGTGAFGLEWLPGRGLAARAGVYASDRERPFVYACAVGLGWAYAFFELDASYLVFSNSADRRGTIAASTFDASRIRDVNMTPYTADHLSLSVKAILGNIKESLARIEGIEMFGGIYPSAYEALAYRPVGAVRVRNTSQKPIQARATFYVERLMDQPTESQAVYIAAGSEGHIPLTAVFNDQMRSVVKTMIRDGTVSVSATVAEDFDDKAQTRVLIHGKNDWDGNAQSLRYFVTPGDPDILRYSRDVLLGNRDSVESGPPELAQLRNARLIFTTFAGRMTYVADPKETADYVQYPSETLTLGGGDCDDMTVCFASLLSSIGISTAFVDVLPPAQPEAGHIYLLFDTGIDPRFGTSVSPNPKRYVIRRGKTGMETIWIPVETTLVTRGFNDAWTAGAQKYFDDVVVGLGLIRGWVKIVDVY
jgi:hypothetical protein